MVLNGNSETFVVHVASLNLAPISVYLDKEARITSLLTKKVKILDEYSDFVNIFLEEKALVLPKRTKLNEYAIDLEDGQQPRLGGAGNFEDLY